MTGDKSTGRKYAGEIAAEYRQRGEFLKWFEALYTVAGENPDAVPWADMKPNVYLVEWLEREPVDGRGKRAVVIGCGLGDDAEHLAKNGFDVTAFDISASAIAWCKKRFPESAVDYRVADLFTPPEEWAFDFVLESYTVQSMPLEMREQAIAAVAKLVAPGGRLLVIGRLAAPEARNLNAMPWPLTHDECDLFKTHGLSEHRFEDFDDPENPLVRRLRVEYRR